VQSWNSARPVILNGIIKSSATSGLTVGQLPEKVGCVGDAVLAEGCTTTAVPQDWQPTAEPWNRTGVLGRTCPIELTET